MTGTATVQRRSLPCRPTSVREGRRLVRETLRAAALEDLTFPCELVASELVTNAVRHAQTEVEVTVSAGRAGVEVRVADGSPRLPAQRDGALTATSGRGLLLVDQVAHRWGVEPTATGKTVWALVDSA